MHPVCEWLSIMQVSEQNIVQSRYDALTLEDVIAELSDKFGAVDQTRLA